MRHSESSENEEKNEEEIMEEDILHLLDEKEKNTIDKMGENMNHEETIQHNNKTRKNMTFENVPLNVPYLLHSDHSG